MKPARSTRIKFCGITRLEDALLAAELGVDYLGFVLVPETPRYRGLDAALPIRSRVPAGVKTVALVQGGSEQFLDQIRDRLRPDLIQFHGAESPAEVRRCGLPYLRAVPMGSPQRWADWEDRYPDAEALLADSHTGPEGGGSGTAFAWTALPLPADRRLPLMLAGGLQPETVEQAVLAVRPWGVDVSSGIESGEKGIKDALKMRAFVAAVRAADAQMES